MNSEFPSIPGRLSINLDVATPVFLGGADPRDSIDLRAPSVRGALRFWFRAMMGGLLGGHFDRCGDSLRRLEGAVFGDTDRASRVQVRLSPREPNTCGTRAFYLRRNGFTGLIYLGNGLQDRRFLEPEQSRLQLGLRFRESGALRQVVLGTVWLWLHFGGVGARTRRGFGGLVADEMSPIGGLHLRPPRNSKRLLHHLKEGLRWVVEAFARYAQQHGVSCSLGQDHSPSGQVPDFSCFADWRAVITHRPASRSGKSKSWVFWEDALDAAGIFLQDFRRRSGRSGRTRDYLDVIAPYLSSDDKSELSNLDLENDAFGLPLLFRSRSWSRRTKRKGVVAKVEWKRRGAVHSRRASPLIIRPIWCGDSFAASGAVGSYAIIWNFFKCRFLPQDAVERLQATKKHGSPRPCNIPVADLGIIDEFLGKVSVDYRAKERLDDRLIRGLASASTGGTPE